MICPHGDDTTFFACPVCARNEAIEECARVAEAYFEDDYTPPVMIDKIAAAIRALKDKP